MAGFHSVSVLLFCVLLSLVNSQRPDSGSLCINCQMENGIGYNPHPSDCNKYVQCLFDDKKLMKVIVKECPHGLYWDQDKVTCNRAAEVNCTFDRCQDYFLTSYPSSTTCSGYWECEDGVSRGRCCPEGQVYSIAGYCVPSTTCKDVCHDTQYDETCGKRPVGGDTAKFEQHVEGHGWIRMDCAPGTSYNATSCLCDIIGGPITLSDTCKSELYLSFTDGVADKSGSGVYIENDGVQIRNGVAHFDGKSVLRIPRFTNAELGRSVYIKLMYKGDGVATTKQALLTNGNCGREGSISIARGAMSTDFSLRSTTGQTSNVSVACSVNGWNEAIFKLDQGTFSGQVGTAMKKRAFTSGIERTHCAMQIGRGTSFDNFHGTMDNITIYLCNPSHSQYGPTAGGWSDWSTWSKVCIHTCGGTVAAQGSRTRVCDNPRPNNGGSDCIGEQTEVVTSTCETPEECPVDGGWSVWTDVIAECSASCGGGSITVESFRQCNNPSLSNGGRGCAGSATKTATEPCNNQECPVDGGWSVWTNVTTECSASCAGGNRTVMSSRQCNNPSPSKGGRDCYGDAKKTTTKSCNNQECPVNGGWSVWTDVITECSASCGDGIITMTSSRQCNDPSPKYGGRGCAGTDTKTATESCNNHECPVLTTLKPDDDLVLCADCQMKNGNGYNPHPSDCNKYVQCMFDGKKLLEMHVKECTHGLYWDQDTVTCNRVAEVNCIFERCQDSLLTSYPSSTTCSGYWECEGGISRGRCCPEGQAYSIAGYCVPSTTCKDVCNKPQENKICDKRPVEGDKYKFEQYVQGNGWVTITCAPGSSYNATSCLCDIIGGLPVTCRAELYLPFTDNTADQSGNEINIENNGVTMQNGVAYFNGKSDLLIPRFTNAELGKYVYIKLRYKGEGVPTKKQALLSNGNCGKEGSISIARGPRSTHFSVRSTSGQSANVTVVSVGNDWNEAIFKLDQGIMSGQVGTVMKQTTFRGGIQRSPCAMQIGRGTSFANFRGVMDNITIYLCKPDL